VLADVLRHLEALVSFDTRNPPRLIGTGGIFDYIREQLPDFDIDVVDHGDGAVSLLALRGQPKRLFNVHLDTVPASPAWQADPLRLRIQNSRAIGLGACDIKGAAAALLAAATRTDGDAALLFTSDEEANDPRCIRAFLDRDHGFIEAIVAEPTECEAVIAHRGVCSVQLNFEAVAGHASAPEALAASAVHQALRWGTRALDFAESQAHQRFGGLTGLRFNIGRIEGGIKANMIAPHAELRFNFRPLPSQGVDELNAVFRDLAGRTGHYAELFRGPPLPAGDVAAAEDRRLAARDLADVLQLPIGNAVDFWTEASLFSQAGMTTLVFGPGSIAQAHAADEWVSLDQLVCATDHYLRLLS
jgi:acetylornithine deacetylase